MISDKYFDLLISNNYINDKHKGVYEDNKTSISYEDFIQLLEYNLIKKSAHIKEYIEKIKDFKILNNMPQKYSSNKIRLRLNLNPNVEIEPKSFKSLDEIEELNSWKDKKLTKVNQISEYETTITCSDFDYLKENLSNLNVADSNQKYINNQKINCIKYKNNNNISKDNTQNFNNNEKKSKFGYDVYYRENSEKVYNDNLVKK